MIIDNSIADCASAGSFSFLFCPIKFAISIFAPIDKPDEIVTISAIISVFVPTAASAFESSKNPTTAVSAALKSCCIMLLKAIGSVNNNSFL